MKALVLSLLAATAAMAGSASAADDLSYSYVQAAYTSVDFDAHGNREGNGIEASWGTSSGVHLFGGFDRSTGGDDGLSSEATSWHAGLGAVFGPRLGVGLGAGRWLALSRMNAARASTIVGWSFGEAWMSRSACSPPGRSTG